MEEKPAIPLPSCVDLQLSPIHGWGLFATYEIQKDQRIGEFIGVEMNHTEFKLQYGNDLRFTCRKTRQHLYRVAKENRNFITYINDGVHNATTPNVNVYIKNWVLYAKRNITVGEELLLDYGKRYWGNLGH